MALRLATPLLVSRPMATPGFSGRRSLANSHLLHSQLWTGPHRRNLCSRSRPRAEGQDSKGTSGEAGKGEQEEFRGDGATSSAQSQGDSEFKDARSSLPTEEVPSATVSSQEQEPGKASPQPSAAKSIEQELDEQLDGIVKALESMTSGEGNGRGTAYSAMATLSRIEGKTQWPLRDEDGLSLSESLPREQLVEALEKLAANPGVEASTAQAVRRTLLGPENESSPFVARATGEVGDFLECEVEAGTLFLGELREGADSAAASEWLSKAVRSSYPGLRVALLPFPDSAEDLAQQLKLDTSRRCSLLLFKRYSVLQFPILRWFTGPAILLALLQLKDVTIQDATLNAGFESAQATALFVVAAILPTTTAFCGQLLWSAAYNRPPPLDFLPVMSPGSGISAVFSNAYAILRSRKEAVDFSLGSLLGSLAASLVLLRSSSCSVPQALPLPVPSLDDLGLPASVTQAATAQVPGTVLVPESILQHAVPLNQMADRLACASLPDPNNDLTVLLALPPLALAGLLGLHLTALGVVPVFKSNGARLVEGTVDDEGLVVLGQALGLIFLAVCFFTTGSPVFPIFFFSSLLAGISSSGELLVPLRWDNVSPAGPLRSLLSAVLVGGGLLLILPKPLYDWLMAAGLGPYAEAFYSLFLPTQ